MLTLGGPEVAGDSCRFASKWHAAKLMPLGHINWNVSSGGLCASRPFLFPDSLDHTNCAREGAPASLPVSASPRGLPSASS